MVRIDSHWENEIDVILISDDSRDLNLGTSFFQLISHLQNNSTVFTSALSAESFISFRRIFNGHYLESFPIIFKLNVKHVSTEKSKDIVLCRDSIILISPDSTASIGVLNLYKHFLKLLKSPEMSGDTHSPVFYKIISFSSQSDVLISPDRLKKQHQWDDLHIPSWCEIAVHSFEQFENSSQVKETSLSKVRAELLQLQRLILQRNIDMIVALDHRTVWSVRYKQSALLLKLSQPQICLSRLATATEGSRLSGDSSLLCECQVLSAACIAFVALYETSSDEGINIHSHTTNNTTIPGGDIQIDQHTKRPSSSPHLFDADVLEWQSGFPSLTGRVASTVASTLNSYLSARPGENDCLLVGPQILLDRGAPPLSLSFNASSQARSLGALIEPTATPVEVFAGSSQASAVAKSASSGSRGVMSLVWSFGNTSSSAAQSPTVENPSMIGHTWTSFTAAVSAGEPIKLSQYLGWFALEIAARTFAPLIHSANTRNSPSAAFFDNVEPLCKRILAETAALKLRNAIHHAEIAALQYGKPPSSSPNQKVAFIGTNASSSNSESLLIRPFLLSLTLVLILASPPLNGRLFSLGLLSRILSILRMNEVPLNPFTTLICQNAPFIACQVAPHAQRVCELLGFSRLAIAFLHLGTDASLALAGHRSNPAHASKLEIAKRNVAELLSVTNAATLPEMERELITGEQNQNWESKRTLVQCRVSLSPGSPNRHALSQKDFQLLFAKPRGLCGLFGDCGKDYIPHTNLHSRLLAVGMAQRLSTIISNDLIWGSEICWRFLMTSEALGKPGAILPHKIRLGLLKASSELPSPDERSRLMPVSVTVRTDEEEFTALRPWGVHPSRRGFVSEKERDLLETTWRYKRWTRIVSQLAWLCSSGVIGVAKDEDKDDCRVRLVSASRSCGGAAGLRSLVQLVGLETVDTDALLRGNERDLLNKKNLTANFGVALLGQSSANRDSFATGGGDLTPLSGRRNGDSLEATWAWDGGVADARLRTLGVDYLEETSSMHWRLSADGPHVDYSPAENLTPPFGDPNSVCVISTRKSYGAVSNGGAFAYRAPDSIWEPTQRWFVIATLHNPTLLPISISACKLLCIGLQEKDDQSSTSPLILPTIPFSQGEFSIPPETSVHVPLEVDHRFVKGGLVGSIAHIIPIGIDISVGCLTSSQFLLSAPSLLLSESTPLLSSKWDALHEISNSLMHDGSLPLDSLCSILNRNPALCEHLKWAATRLVSVAPANIPLPPQASLSVSPLPPDSFFDLVSINTNTKVSICPQPTCHVTPMLPCYECPVPFMPALASPPPAQSRRALLPTGPVFDGELRLTAASNLTAVPLLLVTSKPPVIKSMRGVSIEVQPLGRPHNNLLLSLTNVNGPHMPKTTCRHDHCAWLSTYLVAGGEFETGEKIVYEWACLGDPHAADVRIGGAGGGCVVGIPKFTQQRQRDANGDGDPVRCSVYVASVTATTLGPITISFHLPPPPPPPLPSSSSSPLTNSASSSTSSFLTRMASVTLSSPSVLSTPLLQLLPPAVLSDNEHETLLIHDELQASSVGTSCELKSLSRVTPFQQDSDVMSPMVNLSLVDNLALHEGGGEEEEELTVLERRLPHTFLSDLPFSTLGSAGLACSLLHSQASPYVFPTSKPKFASILSRLRLIAEETSASALMNGLTPSTLLSTRLTQLVSRHIRLSTFTRSHAPTPTTRKLSPMDESTVEALRVALLGLGPLALDPESLKPMAVPSTLLDCPVSSHHLFKKQSVEQLTFPDSLILPIVLSPPAVPCSGSPFAVRVSIVSRTHSSMSNQHNQQLEFTHPSTQFLVSPPYATPPPRVFDGNAAILGVSPVRQWDIFKDRLTRLLSPQNASSFSDNASNSPQSSSWRPMSPLPTPVPQILFKNSHSQQAATLRCNFQYNMSQLSEVCAFDLPSLVCPVWTICAAESSDSIFDISATALNRQVHVSSHNSVETVSNLGVSNSMSLPLTTRQNTVMNLSSAENSFSKGNSQFQDINRKVNNMVARYGLALMQPNSIFMHEDLYYQNFNSNNWATKVNASNTFIENLFETIQVKVSRKGNSTNSKNGQSSVSAGLDHESPQTVTLSVNVQLNSKLIDKNKTRSVDGLQLRARAILLPIQCDSNIVFLNDMDGPVCEINFKDDSPSEICLISVKASFIDNYKNNIEEDGPLNIDERLSPNIGRHSYKMRASSTKNTSISNGYADTVDDEDEEDKIIVQAIVLVECVYPKDDHKLNKTGAGISLWLADKPLETSISSLFNI